MGAVTNRLSRPIPLVLAATIVAASPFTLNAEVGMLLGSQALAKDGGENRSGGGNHSSGSGHSGSGNSSKGDRTRRGEGTEARAGRIEVVYPDGFREELEGGVLELKDPSGRTVVKRRATAEDVARLRRMAAP